jgi:mannosyltransferase OCH1-like enzyme
MQRVVFLSALWVMSSLFAKIAYPDFLVSMMRQEEDLAKFAQRQKDDSLQNFEIFHTAYARNVLLTKGQNETYRIPKIIHQIWLGSPVPAKYFEWIKSWTKWNGWDYKLWTDDDVKHLLLYNQDLYEKAKSYGEKTDIIRLELLLHYGGIYVDTDFEALNPEMFDELNRCFDFYVGFEPLEHGTINGMCKICNAIIASAPHHPLIKNLIIQMKPNWIRHEHETGIQKAGPDYFSRTILDYEKGILLSPEVKANNQKYRNMYLPCTFFYPLSEPEVSAAKSLEDITSKFSEETAAIHYWSGSWFIPGGR